MNSIQDYLQELRKAMSGSDPATIQDALNDAAEYLNNAISPEQQTKKEDMSASLQSAIDEYGSPNEVAAAYLDAEQRLFPELRKKRKMENRSALTRFFSIYADGRVWGSFLYMLISLITGIVYFTWTTTIFSLSVSFIIFIFGLFFLLFFLYSLRGIGLLEGRIVEALLGIRMPRRPLFKPRNLKWSEQLKLLLKEKHTWFTMIYTIMQLPLGVLYFTLVITLTCLSLAAISIPIIQYCFHIAAVTISQPYFFPAWSMPLFVLGGALVLTLTLYLVKGIGILHGKWAKLMLVSD